MIEQGTDQPPVDNRYKASQDDVADFLLSLIQAFLRTGYYLPGHPESHKAKAGLFEKFNGLVEESGEMTLLLRGEGPQSRVYIEGLSEKSIQLADIMLKGMAETYNPRFVQFLERKELISLSINSRMEADEFSRLIDLMSEPFLEDMKESSTKEKFVSCLKERKIQNLSFVFNQDFITERRNIPWRSVLALSRLRKDLSLVPIFRDLKTEEIGNVRREIIDDIMRPLNLPELIYSFLMNLDLAATADLSEDEAEREVINIVREDAFLLMVPIFIKDAAGEHKKYKDLRPPEKFVRILGRICGRLNRIDRPEARATIEDMFHAGLLSMEDLSLEIRQRIMTIQLTASFLDNRENYLKHFEKTTSPEDYSKRSHKLATIVPYLIERGKYEEAAAITGKLASHGMEKSERADLARKALAWISEGESLNEAQKAFMTSAKEERIHLGEFFAMMGQLSVPHLLSTINQTDDPWKRKHGAELLIRIGPKAASSLISEIEEGKVVPEAVSTIIRVLGHVPEGPLLETAARIVKEKINDADVEVRREAVNALGRLLPKGELGLFKRKLGDPDPKVKKSAVRGLGLTGDIKALEILSGIVSEFEKQRKNDQDELASTAIDSLGHLEESCPEAKQQVADYLLELAGRIYPESSWKKLVGRSHKMPESCLLAMADALGRVGGEKARRFLLRMTEDSDKALSRKAADILKKFDE